VQSGALPSWDLEADKIVDPAAPSTKEGATAANLLQRPDLTDEQRARLEKAAATVSAQPPKATRRPMISAHLLARVRQKVNKQ
jgi:hypothetical protein